MPAKSVPAMWAEGGAERPAPAGYFGCAFASSELGECTDDSEVEGLISEGEVLSSAGSIQRPSRPRPSRPTGEGAGIFILMGRRKRKRVGGSYTQKPSDLRDRGPSGEVTVIRMTPEELEELRERRRAQREARHAAGPSFEPRRSQAS
jgi:hypothetical protein